MALGFGEASYLVAAGVAACTVAAGFRGDPGYGVDGLPVNVHKSSDGCRDWSPHALPSGFGVAELDHRFHPCSFYPPLHIVIVSVPDSGP